MDPTGSTGSAVYMWSVSVQQGHRKGCEDTHAHDRLLGGCEDPCCQWGVGMRAAPTADGVAATMTGARAAMAPVIRALKTEYGETHIIVTDGVRDECEPGTACVPRVLCEIKRVIVTT